MMKQRVRAGQELRDGDTLARIGLPTMVAKYFEGIHITLQSETASSV